MSKKSEALRLADALMEEHPFPRDIRLAAAELRRLHAQRDALRAELKEATEAINDPAVNNLRTLPESIRVLCAQRDALLEALRAANMALNEADDLLRIARYALLKMRLDGLGSDCRLSHEVRMFSLEFSRESRDGPGVLQVNGTGRSHKALQAIRAAQSAIAKAEGRSCA